MLGLNTSRAGRATSASGAIPGREQDFAAVFRQALDYALAIGARQIHCMAGTALPEQRAAAETTFVAEYLGGCGLGHVPMA